MTHIYKDDWDSEDEDLLAQVLSDLTFSAEKITSASTQGRGLFIMCSTYIYPSV